jgi:hypothetical protein
MDPVTLETTIKVHLKEIRERLDHAASIARAAQTVRSHRQHREGC